VCRGAKPGTSSGRRGGLRWSPRLAEPGAEPRPGAAFITKSFVWASSWKNTQLLFSRQSFPPGCVVWEPPSIPAQEHRGAHPAQGHAGGTALAPARTSRLCTGTPACLGTGTWVLPWPSGGDWDLFPHPREPRADPSHPSVLTPTWGAEPTWGADPDPGSRPQPREQTPTRGADPNPGS